MELVYGMGHTNVEAARVLGVSSNTVGLRLLRTKQKSVEFLKGGHNEQRN